MSVAYSINDAFQVRLVGRMEGQETNNVLHFSAKAAGTDVEVDLILVLLTCFITHILPVATSSWTLEKVLWKRVHPTLSNEFEVVTGGMGPGGGNAAALPSFNSAVFSIRTNTGGRSHRGRMYLPGIPEAATINSSLDNSNAYWTALLAFAACVMTNFGGGDLPGSSSFQFQVYSRKLGGSTFPYGSAGFTPVISFIPHTPLGTTRSRKVGRGS